MAIYIAAEDVLPVLHYWQDGALQFQKWVCCTGGKWQSALPVIAKEDYALSVYISAKEAFLPPFIANETERIIFKKWVCRTGAKAFNRRLVHSVA